MAVKAGPATEELHLQIDELDALLDRLLKLPLGPAPPAAKSNPALKLVGAGDSMLDVMDEAAELEEPVLRFRSIEQPEESAKQVPLTNDFGTFPTLEPEAAGADDAPPADVFSLPTTPEAPSPVNRLDPQRIPWLEDEPAPKAPSAELAQDTSPDPLSTLRGIQAAGPRIEIVQGSLSTSVMLPDGSLADTGVEAPAESVGLLRRLCWISTWLFDVTVGLLFPGLRRTRGKRVVALAGLGLLATSAYLAWRWWW